MAHPSMMHQDDDIEREWRLQSGSLLPNGGSAHLNETYTRHMPHGLGDLLGRSPHPPAPVGFPVIRMPLEKQHTHDLWR
jgi:hypothetical protein